MRKYELAMIIDPSISDADRTNLLSEIRTELTSVGAEKISEDILGAKKLAYKIHASETGFYVLYTFDFPGRGGFFGVTNDFNLKKTIWRHMFVRLDDVESLEYKDIESLKKSVTKFNKIVPRQYSGTTLKEQKKIAQAIKRARYMALLPYVLDLKKKVGAE